MPWIDEDAAMVSPVEGTVGGGFSDRRSHGGHHAIDWRAPAGSEVRAPGNMRFVTGGQGGTNLRPNDWWSYWQDIDTGVQYRFAHHGPLSGVQPGQLVQKGQVWNEVGHAISGPHLHMSVWYQNQPIDYGKMLGLSRGKQVTSAMAINPGESAAKIAAKVPSSGGQWEEVEDQPEEKKWEEVNEEETMPWLLRKAGEVADLPGIKQVLQALDLPMKPVRAAKEAAVKQMMKVPALASEQEVPLEAMYPEMMAGQGAKGQTGITMKAPPLAKTIGETGELLSVWPVYGAVGKALGLMRTIPGINKIKGIGKAPLPKGAPASVEALETEAKQAAQQAKLEKVAGLKEEAYPVESPVAAKPWELKAKMEDVKRVEPPPSTPIEAATVDSLSHAEASEALPPTPERLTFQQAAKAATGGQPRRPRGIELPEAPIETGRRLDPIPKEIGSDINVIDREIRSNNIVAANKFSTTNNPINDHFTGRLNYFNRVTRFGGWLQDTVKHYKMGQDIKESVREGQRLLAPIFERFVNLREPEVKINNQMAELRARYGKINPESEAAKQIQDAVEALVNQKKAYKKSIQPQIKQIYSQRQLVIDNLKKRYANVRIKAALGGDEKAAALLTDSEKQIVEQSRKYYNMKKAELDAQGIRTRGDDYVNFLLHEPLSMVGKTGHLDLGAMDFVRDLWYGKQKLSPEILSFVSRTPGAKDWWPFWYQSMKSYIPAVERKLSFNPFLTKWNPEAAKWKTSHPGAFQWYQDFVKKNFLASENEFAAGVMNKIINFEYLRTLFGNIGPAVLHAFKQIQLFAWHGIGPMTRASGRFAKGMAQKVTGRQGVERQVLDLYSPWNDLTRSIEQVPGVGRAMKGNFWRSLRTGGTAVIEYMENGMNALATIERGAKAGMAPPEIHQRTLDMIMRLNFRGFNMPKVMTSPTGRMFTMFMGQPTKLLENKLDLLVQGLRGARDKFHNERELWKFLRLVGYLGLTYAAGRSQGVDLMKHVFHIPGESIAPKTGETTISLFPPPMELAYQVAQEGPRTAAYKHFLNIPGLDRISRLASGEMKPRFKEPWTQFAGIPKAGWEEEYRERISKGAKRREKYERKRRTAAQKWWDEIMGR